MAKQNDEEYDYLFKIVLIGNTTNYLIFYQVILGLANRIY
jgi:hypothetical protein